MSGKCELTHRADHQFVDTVLLVAKHAPTAGTTKAQMSTMTASHGNRVCSIVLSPWLTLHPPVPWLCWMWGPALQPRAQYPEIGGLLYGKKSYLLCLLFKGSNRHPASSTASNGTTRNHTNECRHVGTQAITDRIGVAVNTGSTDS